MPAVIGRDPAEVMLLSPLDRARALAYFPDGTLLAVVSGSGIPLLDPLEPGTDPRPLRLLTDRSRVVNALAFSPDGALLATGGTDGTVRLWRCPSGEGVATLVTLPPRGWAVLPGQHPQAGRRCRSDRPHAAAGRPDPGARAPLAGALIRWEDPREKESAPDRQPGRSRWFRRYGQQRGAG
ncbi:WD40 repeat domain-containing protein [Parafrankia discariae]|uniref:WD40 repeat domain-containing protein n=1 Tax=Parafrankia discariae TaxID=365528 RepID=UPI0003A4682E|nr:hypothetical protein [Parafrankia discariae]